MAKKQKKLKTTIQASFQAETGWDRLRMREKENYRSDPSYSIKNRKFRKKKRAKKQKNLTCTFQASFQTKKGQDRLRKREKKIIAPIHPTRP